MEQKIPLSTPKPTPKISKGFPWIILIIFIIASGINFYIQQGKIKDLQEQVSSYEKELADKSKIPTHLDDIVAKSVLPININDKFNIKALPRMDFLVGNVYKATGGVDTLEEANCTNGISSTTDIIAIRYFENDTNDAKEWCMDTKYIENVTGIKDPGLIGAELEINNDSPDTIADSNGYRFVRVFYYEQLNDKKTLRLAPNWTNAETVLQSLSSQKIRQGYIIPSDAQEIFLIYGNFADSTGTDSFKRAEAGYRLDFGTKAFSKLTTVDVTNLLWQYKF